MKTINAAKLKAMGDSRVQEVCVWHAERAIGFKESGNTRMLNRHCSLLDQCAAVLRELRGRPKRRR